jgi:hypothetical protein
MLAKPVLLTNVVDMKQLTIMIMLLVVSGCETVSNMTVREEVKPWEKDVLATDTMQFPRDPMQSYLDDHIYFSKEASTGGNGVGGGGCGCN